MARPPKQSNASSTKQQLILAAAQQFAQFGFQGASLSKIRETVGVKNSTIMYYFKSKAGLYNAVKQHLEQSLGEFVDSLILNQQSLPVLERFSQFCHSFKDWSTEEQTYTAIIVQEMMNNQLPEIEGDIYKNIGQHYLRLATHLQGSPTDPLWRELNWPVFMINLTFSILVGQALSVGVPVTFNLEETSYQEQQILEVIRTNLLANIKDSQMVLEFLNTTTTNN
ncbi:TetR/AcrR family transcriptional regulator [Thalassomonas sp. M1454]|uniref:TetR/AcrR family transcriptional regulator n=1 Tax=Thalassomonas sp. M1454 TaxID=2594477 RepID=UPI00163D4CA4|nr:TetR/AcrR family transcriptional regulator [Thalassomonas sp. M1454]